jgi:hypothetical protein
MIPGAFCFIFFAFLAIAAPAIAADKPVHIPGKPGVTAQRFGSGALIKEPGQPPKSVAPFGRGVIIKEPGKADVQCQPFGSTYRCR